MLEFAYPWVFWFVVSPIFVWLLMPVHREEVSAVRLPFFGMIAEILGIRADEAVFLDDLGMNLKPARELGMVTIKVVSEQQALDELEEVVGFPLS
jgi:hypothetical protein